MAAFTFQGITRPVWNFALPILNGSIDNLLKRLRDKYAYRWGVSVVELVSGVLFRMDVARQAPLPEGPKIIAPNHPSTTDPFLILTLTRDKVSILIDDRLFKVPIFGRYLKAAGHIPVVPGQGREAFEEARRRLDAGQSVAIFPEGSISPAEGGLHPPRTGAARLALLTGAPVIPVGIHLDPHCIKRIDTEIDGKIAMGTWYFNGPYAMTVGEPLHIEGDLDDRKSVTEASERIMRHIAYLAQESAYRMATSQVLASLGSGRIAYV
ncbi:MAG: 1-acyl-sn-glycerol-3-phosphate acyltransferase [Anaerolineae bacterium]|nr:1-acyl-sn-glycerol-3-phosphate acyltransferase [Anaerolineae bacterium]